MMLPKLCMYFRQDLTMTDMKKILIFAVFLVFLLFIFIIPKFKAGNNIRLEAQPTKVVLLSGGTFSLEPSEIKTPQDKDFILSIQITAPGKQISGADDILRFDPDYLTAEEITPGNIFSNYLRTQTDNEKGFVKITAFTPTDKLNTSVNMVYATVKFRAKQKGNTTVGFDFQIGTTNKSTIVEEKTSRNILEQVLPAKITIE